MSSRRTPAPPPDIEGYAYVSLVGSGGFSDVYCYQQSRPRRRVAIKVLLQEWSSDSQREAFDAEADLLASLSTHPSIVTMYEASVSDDGRPYLAMEYCSRASLGDRYRSERLSVPEVLRTAVLVAGAVETAHRAGILHRDIKPANLLVTDYGHPVLTDFGISATVDKAGIAEGMSIPWSPPESFAEVPTSGVGTDVWALGATTYSLLAGRSPFEVPGGQNASADLIGRIESTPLPALGRSDVPASLERVLATAMAKSADARFPSALAFARALQSVQQELSLAATPIDVLDDSGAVQDVGVVPGGGNDTGWAPAASGSGGGTAGGGAAGTAGAVGAGVAAEAAAGGVHGSAADDHDHDDDDDAGTRLRQVVSIDPAGPVARPASPPPARPSPARPAPAWTPAVPAQDEPADSTVLRPGHQAAQVSRTDQSARTDQRAVGTESPRAATPAPPRPRPRTAPSRRRACRRRSTSPVRRRRARRHRAAARRRAGGRAGAAALAGRSRGRRQRRRGRGGRGRPGGHPAVGHVRPVRHPRERRPRVVGDGRDDRWGAVRQPG
ncbi:hypothetical protein GCM10025865_05560 [Paraoerskovia sediminicola]|uniref:Protein kinase domain-containing protein n=1 Tax=Paraoerskovia sediminicola TaxID=1138587 RepID=A0ABN6X8V9_9CELL|nr:serine/threonine-protein kinase [Paraoerskovia sediminicola]BDZ41257.1 hypothetical protein GCM10025865_05560 [Paraoerskovia sediminicola]